MNEVGSADAVVREGACNHRHTVRIILEIDSCGGNCACTYSGGPCRTRSGRRRRSAEPTSSLSQMPPEIKLWAGGARALTCANGAFGFSHFLQVRPGPLSAAAVA